MPKITSTPTASSERTRLCAPVMPETGSGMRAAGRAAVSTPASAAAASWVADSLGGASRGGSSRGGGVLIAAISWAVRGAGGLCGAGGGGDVVPGQQKTPRAAGTEGSARRSGTDALGDYEEAAGRTHPHT